MASLGYGDEPIDDWVNSMCRIARLEEVLRQIAEMGDSTHPRELDKSDAYMARDKARRVLGMTK